MTAPAQADALVVEAGARSRRRRVLRHEPGLRRPRAAARRRRGRAEREARELAMLEEIARGFDAEDERWALDVDIDGV